MLPDIDQIQGGMGVNISNPALANAVARLGKRGTILATVSGVAVDKIMLILLQSGDPGGDIQRALSHFPSREVVTEILDRYYVPGGLPPGAPYKLAPMLRIDQPSPWAITLLVCANFAFVWLAKEGHSNPISINWLEKMQRFHLYSIAGAMLAGVDVVTMGAGIPHQTPHVLDAYAHGRPAEYRVTVTDCKDRTMTMQFDPREFFGRWWPKEFNRPSFIPIVSSHVLAEKLMEVAPGGIDAVVA
jgi:NAD(P)H-dependent flavin oxidoreductase YrpB (nitropropane dioxygenase family)